MADFTAQFLAKPTSRLSLRRRSPCLPCYELTSLRPRVSIVAVRHSEDEQKPRDVRSPRQVEVNLSSNNYLGLTTHRAYARARSSDAAVRRGAPIGEDHRRHDGDSHGARTRIAESGQRSGRVFPSGFAANAGTVSAVLGKDYVVVSDEPITPHHRRGRLSPPRSRWFRKYFARRESAHVLPAPMRAGPLGTLLITDVVQHGRRPRTAADRLRWLKIWRIMW